MLGFNDTNRNRAHSNANRMDEMLRRMQEMQQQQYSQPTQQAPKKSPNKKADDGEYIDYEEVDWSLLFLSLRAFLYFKSEYL